MERCGSDAAALKRAVIGGTVTLKGRGVLDRCRYERERVDFAVFHSLTACHVSRHKQALEGERLRCSPPREWRDGGTHGLPCADARGHHEGAFHSSVFALWKQLPISASLGDEHLEEPCAGDFSRAEEGEVPRQLLNIQPR